jgi:hypothetical protein
MFQGLSLKVLGNGVPLDCAYPVIKETIPASQLGYKSNNRYDGFPPLMNDGRSINATARSETLLHNSLLKESGETNNAKYREYMVKNAMSIMENDFRNASNDVGYYERFIDEISSKGTLFPSSGSAQSGTFGSPNKPSGAPYTFKSIMDDARPLGYVSSDLKSLYLSREQHEARRVAPHVRF